MSDLSAIFPCWGRHERMGHNHVIGQFEAGPGTSAICRVPELPANADACLMAVPARALILPMDGPAFYGFEALTEAQAMSALVASQPTDWGARNERRLLAASDAATEITDRDDEDLFG